MKAVRRHRPVDWLRKLQRASLPARIKLASSLRTNPVGAPLGSIVMRLLQDPSPQVRSAALAAAGRCEEPPIAALTHALDGEQPLELRRQAAGLFALFGDRASGAVPKLIETLSDDDPTLRFQAGLALGRQGPAVARALLGALKGRPSPSARLAMIEALGWTGSQTAEAETELLEALRTASPEQAVVLQWTRARCGATQPDPIAALTALAQHESPSVRVAALEKLMTLKEDAPRWQTAIPSLTEDTDPAVRATALRTLLQTELTDAEVAALAKSGLEDPEPEPRAMACLVFASRDLDCNEAAPRLIQLHSDPSRRVRALARQASDRVQNG